MRDDSVVIALRIVAVLVGLPLLVLVMSSALRTVVLPRAAGSFLTRTLFLGMRRVFTVLAPPSQDFWARDRILAYYAPVSLVLLPGVWIAFVLTGFTGLYFGAGVSTLREAFLISGSSVLTLGVRFHAAIPVAMLSFLEAGLGLGLIALLISYLPSMYSSFNRREMLVGMLEVRAGSPPSPAELLTRYQRIDWLDSIHSELFPRWEEWFMDLEESHTSLPALVYFRSPQPERSWVTAAGCVLDTAALVASTLDRPHDAGADVLMRTGFFALRRIADYFSIPYDANPKPDDPISVSRREFDLLCVELTAAGVPLRPDRDQAWRDFAGWRANYDTVLVALAKLVVAPPGKWSSDRPSAEVNPSAFRRTRPKR